MMDLDPAAVEAAAKAMWDREHAPRGSEWGTLKYASVRHRDLASQAIEAAYPFIAAAVERRTADAIAADIERRLTHPIALICADTARSFPKPVTV